MKKGLKKAFGIFGDVILVLLILLALSGIIYSFSKSTSHGYSIPKIFGKWMSVVQTESMDTGEKGCIKAGDLVFGDSNTSYSDLKVGDIVFFLNDKVLDKDGNQTTIVVVHRIYEEIIDIHGTVLGYRTKGDANPYVDQDNGVDALTEANYVGTYTGKVGGFGKVINFLTSSLGFGLCIVLPIFLYLIWQVIKLVQVIMHNKKVDMMADAAAGVESEDVKQAIINEYLAKQEALKKEQEQKELESKKDDAPKE